VVWEHIPPLFTYRGGFTVLQTTFSWLDQKCRLSKDYEMLTATSEASVYVAMTRLMARRLASL
jgi:transposase